MQYGEALLAAAAYAGRRTTGVVVRHPPPSAMPADRPDRMPLRRASRAPGDPSAAPTMPDASALELGALEAMLPPVPATGTPGHDVAPPLS